MHIHPKKSLGQNFLTDPHYLRKIVEAAQVSPADQVLEIGPGKGHLTRELAVRAGRLIVIELDDRLVPLLREDFGGTATIEIVHGDALLYDYGSLPGTWKVVANLPYYISTPIIQRLIAHRERFSTLTLMLQKEVAERVAADPGGKEYGYLSVRVQYFAVPRLEFTVPAGAFTPRPKVDSAVLTLVMREHPERPVADEDLFLRVIKAAFSQRRKTLRNSLSQLGYPRELMDAIPAGTGIDLGRRAETLSVVEFGVLADFLGGNAHQRPETVKT
ncbi:MAG: 16S rRNA (adenine(1518)-N(6)/adenine(1519)-N(6))-dimethyltransferase RsmA [Nitrospirota bacterium]